LPDGAEVATPQRSCHLFYYEKQSAFLREKAIAIQEFTTKPGGLSTIRIVDFKNGGR